MQHFFWWVGSGYTCPFVIVDHYFVQYHDMLMYPQDGTEAAPPKPVMSTHWPSLWLHCLQLAAVLWLLMS